MIPMDELKKFLEDEIQADKELSMVSTCDHQDFMNGYIEAFHHVLKKIAELENKHNDNKLD